MKHMDGSRTSCRTTLIVFSIIFGLQVLGAVPAYFFGINIITIVFLVICLGISMIMWAGMAVSD